MAIAERKPKASRGERVEAAVAPKRFKLGYRPEFDGLRGIAVLTIALGHLPNFPIRAGGNMGVEFFLVFSGFLITTLLIEERGRSGSVDLRSFYARRALRILPAMYLVLGALLAVIVLNELVPTPLHDRVAEGTDRWLVGIGATFFHVSNWFAALQISNLGPLAHTWTLASIEQFYLLWPPLLIVLLRRQVNFRHIAYALAFLVILVTIERALLYEPGNYWRARYGLDTRGDSLLVGCILAVLFEAGTFSDLGRHARLMIKGAAIAAAAALVIMGFTVSGDSAASIYGLSSLTTISIAAVFVYLITESPGRVHAALSLRFLVLMGKFSYGFYLWHHVIVNGLHASSPPGWLVSIVLAVVMTVFSYYVVEQPVMRWKNRHFHRAPAAAAI